MANPIFAAINSGRTINVAVMTTIGKGDELQPAIINLFSTTSLDQAKSKLLELKFNSLSYVATQADAENPMDTIIYITDKFSITGQIEQTKADLQLNDDYQVGYFNFDCRAMFCAMPKETAQNTGQTLKDFHTGSSIISSLELSLVHLYARVYEANNCTAIIHFSDTQVSVVVVERTSPIWVGALIADNDDPIETVIKLLGEFRASIPNVPIERMLLAGDTNRTHLEALEDANRVKPIVVEFFNPLLGNFINTSLLSQSQLNLLERESYKFAPVIGSVELMTENSGLDLSTNQELLTKTFSQTPKFYSPFNLTNSLTEITNIAKTKIVAAATSQSKLLIVGVIIAVALVAYNYYETSNKLVETDASIKVETTIATQLKPFQDRYKAYQQKLAIKNNQISQIREIQKSQLVIPTILDELQRVQFPLQELVNFSTIEINGRNLQVSGNAIDKAQTIELLATLRRSNTSRFLDINPTYGSNDLIRCEFGFTASYGGPIQVNPIKLPVSNNTSQVAQISSR